MKYLEESNKNLINLRTSLIAVVALLTGGLVGVSLANMSLVYKSFLLIFGIYFEILFITNIMRINEKINKNIGVIKNECK